MMVDCVLISLIDDKYLISSFLESPSFCPHIKEFQELSGPVMRFLLLPFIILPILEMLVLIKVGGMIGAWNTVALVLLGGIIGLQVIRQQGLSTMIKAQQKMASGELPATEMVEGFMIAMGGGLMMLPGLLTDVLGVLLLIPPVRKYIIGRMVASGRWRVQQTNIYEAEFNRETHWDSEQTHIRHTIDGEFSKDDEKK